MPKLRIIDFLRRRRSIPSNLLKAGPVLNLREGEAIIVTYTSGADKMKVFSAFVREGLENGDAVYYIHPDRESGTARARFNEHGINVEKHEKEGTLCMVSQTEHFMSSGKLDYERAVIDNLNWWVEAKKKGYKHVRNIEDVGDFSFANGQWQKYVADYWLDPRWDDPNGSEWVESREPVGVVYSPFVMEITAINVERMAETQVDELLKAFGRGTLVPARFIDLFENMDLFSRSMGLDHERLIGRKILLEFDPVSNYEKVVDSMAKESAANVEPIFVFASRTSSIHKRLAKRPTIKFFLTSISASIPEPTSENEVVLPAKNVPLILDALDKALETYADAKVCFVFGILSELLTSVGRERTFIFLRNALDMLSSRKMTGLFMLNSSAHQPEAVSQIRGLFNNLLRYDKNGLEVVKLS